MDSHCIAYSDVPHSSALLLDYLYHFERVAAYYAASPHDPSSYKAIAAQLGNLDRDRRELCDVLARQNEEFGSSEATRVNIQRLRDPRTFAVVTGQQVGLFSGPAFTLYKALTAVRLAQSLSEQGLPCVPVFWLATEDHDLEEVASASILDAEYNLVTVRDAGHRPAPRSPVGQVRLTAEVLQALDLVEAQLPAGPPRDQLLSDLRGTFQPGRTWSHAFAAFLTRLFGRFGVVLLDPLDAAVSRLTAGVYEHALTQADELRARVLERSRALVREGYHAQAHVAEDSTLVFVARQGNRVALHHRGGEFRLDEDSQATTRAELLALLRSSPEDFSPNVLLRPVVQDTLLPTLAYVAGPSELAYLAQAQVLYEPLGRPQPVIVPRSAFTLVDSRIQRLLEKYQINVEDVWQGEEHLGRKIAASALAEGWAERFDQSERDLAQLLDRLHQDIERLDPTLLDTLGHVKEKMTYQMEKLKGKLSRAAIGRSDLLARHEQTLRRFLMPAKDLQERQVSGIYFLGRAGYELLDRLLAQIQASCADHQVATY